MIGRITLTLDRVICVSESEHGSEPYLWPVLALLDDQAVVRAERIRSEDSHLVMAREMRAGQEVAVPAGARVTTAAADLSHLLAVVVLVAVMEADDVPAYAMEAGYRAFVQEVPSALNFRTLLSLSELQRELDAATDPAEKARIQTEITAVKTQVRNQLNTAATAAVRSTMTWIDKIRVALGSADSLVGSVSTSFSASPGQALVIPPTRLELTAGDGRGNEFRLIGSIKAQPNPIDLCQVERTAVREARDRLRGLNAQLRMLQNELVHASPGAKPGIRQSIERLGPIIAAAEQALRDAEAQLAACTARPIPPFDPDLGSVQ